MTSIRAQLIFALTTNTRLLNTLSEASHAVPSLSQSNTYISSLSNEIALSQKKLRKATQTVAFEYADHKKYRDSHVRRIAYKLSGKKEKFEDEASKEEKEWLAAVQEELHVKRALEELERKMGEAKRENEELKSVVEVHYTAQKELDELYKSIFDGPTPEVLGEDVKEAEVREAEKEFGDKQWKFSTEKKARSILVDADKFLTQARRDIDEALDLATMDCWGVGGTFTDMQKSSVLSRAQGHVAQVGTLMGQARRLDPDIGDIGQMDVPEMRWMTDVVFDNLFSDLNAKERIREAKGRLERAKERLITELRRAEGRIEGVRGEVESAGKLLDGKRGELQGSLL
ncbi:hypothetical protein G7Y89_g14974 [Cudoniella acicularis]|uniref:Uncharacterized protein n=1 Tax=Cudoniella acicularis TaxID=354080 RepID=A0A8H4VQ18_9HELO|nr:hypothetical protein G7Y89_g14974 [Cudoniella acicularis]